MLTIAPRLLQDVCSSSVFSPCSVDHVASAGITKFVVSNSSRLPASFCTYGVLRLVLDDMGAEVSFELPPARFASFLVGEPKAFPFVIRWCLPLATGLLEGLAGDEGESEFMMVRGREKREKGYLREGWRD
jgi:hypothetical protein